MTEKNKYSIDLQFFAEKPKDKELDQKTDIKEEKKVETDLKKEAEPEKANESKLPINEDHTEIISSLESQISDLNAQLDKVNSENQDLKNQITELNTVRDNATQELKATEEKIEDYSKVLEEIVEEKEKTIPENIKALMPLDLPVEKKLDWLNKAAGVKPTSNQEKKVVEIGKPTPVNDQKIDQSELSARQKMANAFSGIFK